MRSGFLPARVVQVHPTRACNLACAHCYSDSSPNKYDALGAAPLIDALAGLRAEGYEIVSFSGGEPLVYRELDRVACAAREQGYRAHLITNGLLLSETRLQSLRASFDLVGVSLDGQESTHNAVRLRADAFAKAMRALRVLSESDMRFGIVFAVTAKSFGDVPWVFELASELGAALLHLRPLAPEGRARSMSNDWALGEEDCTRLYVLGELLAAHSPDTLRVQVDLVPASHLSEARTQFALLNATMRIETLSDAVNPLVIDERGCCLPFSYGIDPGLELANILATETTGAYRPRPESMLRITKLLERAFDEAEQDSASCIDWFAHLTRMSRDQGRERMPNAAALTA